MQDRCLNRCQCGCCEKARSRILKAELRRVTVKQGGAPRSIKGWYSSFTIPYGVPQPVTSCRSVLDRFPNGISKRFITRAEFGERYGLGKRTVARVLAMKNIRTITIPWGKRNQRNHTLIDLKQLQEPPTIPGRICTLPTAAAAIGVTAAALSKLRASRQFEVKYLVRRNGYHERDIKQFIERLLSLNPNPMTKTLPRDCITLYQAMCLYHGTGEGGVSIIRALLSGELRVLGNIDGTVRGLFVSRAEFHQFGMNERARHNGHARTPSEVAKEIHCEKKCVRSLVERGLLNGWHTPTGLRISEPSIARFKKKYVPLMSIARDIGSSAAALMRQCAAKHIPMVVVKYQREEVRQAFVRRRDRNEALSFRPVRVLTNHKRVTTPYQTLQGSTSVPSEPGVFHDRLV